MYIVFDKVTADDVAQKSPEKRKTEEIHKDERWERETVLLFIEFVRIKKKKSFFFLCMYKEKKALSLAYSTRSPSVFIYINSSSNPVHCVLFCVYIDTYILIELMKKEKVFASLNHTSFCYGYFIPFWRRDIRTSIHIRIEVERNNVFPFVVNLPFAYTTHRRTKSFPFSI